MCHRSMTVLKMPLLRMNVIFAIAASTPIDDSFSITMTMRAFLLQTISFESPVSSFIPWSVAGFFTSGIRAVSCARVQRKTSRATVVLCMQLQGGCPDSSKADCSSFGPNSRGSEIAKGVQICGAEFSSWKKWPVEGRLSSGLFFSQKQSFFVPFEAPVP
eukprot:Gb_34693 [translate_table: standard]